MSKIMDFWGNFQDWLSITTWGGDTMFFASAQGF